MNSLRQNINTPTNHNRLDIYHKGFQFNPIPIDDYMQILSPVGPLQRHQNALGACCIMNQLTTSYNVRRYFH